VNPGIAKGELRRTRGHDGRRARADIDAGHLVQQDIGSNGQVSCVNQSVDPVGSPATRKQRTVRETAVLPTNHKSRNSSAFMRTDTALVARTPRGRSVAGIQVQRPFQETITICTCLFIQGMVSIVKLNTLRSRARRNIILRICQRDPLFVMQAILKECRSGPKLARVRPGIGPGICL
jgi:hypothetical protein